MTLPLLLIFVSIENIFAAGAAVLAGRQLGAKETEGASRTVSTVVAASALVGVVLCLCCQSRIFSEDYDHCGGEWCGA